MAFNPFDYLKAQKELFTPIIRKTSKAQQTREKLEERLKEYDAVRKLRESWEDMTASMYFDPKNAHQFLKTQLEPLATELAQKAKDKDVKKIAKSFRNIIGAYVQKMKEIRNYLVERGRAFIYQQQKKIREASEKISEEEAKIAELLKYKFD